MSRETTIVDKKYRHWSGTPSDILRIARQAEELLRTANAQTPQASVKVKHQRGESAYDSPEEFSEHLNDIDLKRVETVHILAGDTWSDIGIIVNFFKNGPYVRVEGKGSHHLLVGGVATDMITELDRGDRSYPHARIIGYTLAAVGAILVLGSLVATLVADPPRGIVLALDGIGLWMIVAYGWILGIRAIVVPGCELHPDGEQSRAERWGAKLRRFGVWGLTLVIAAVLGALVQRWLG